MAVDPGEKPRNMIRLLLRLQQSGRGMVSARELLDHFGCSQKTLRRWVKAFEPLYELGGQEPVIAWRSKGPDGAAWVVLNRPPISLSPNIYNYAAVYLATRHLAVLGDLDMVQSAEIVLDKLSENGGVDPGDIASIDDAFYYLPFGPKQYDDANEEVTSQLFVATLRQYAVEAIYRVKGEPGSPKELHPLTLVVYRDGLYVVARQADNGFISVFAVDRFDSVKQLSHGFDRPDDYAPKEYFSDGLGLWRTGNTERVSLAFKPGPARTAQERAWQGAAGWRQAEDGRYILDLDVAINPELVSWIVSWGGSAEVLAPESLRERVAHEHATALELYDA